MSKKKIKIDSTEIEEEAFFRCPKCGSTDEEDNLVCAIVDAGEELCGNEIEYCCNDGEFHLCRVHYEKLKGLNLL